jgi:type IV pilus assembly protein PilB
MVQFHDEKQLARIEALKAKEAEEYAKRLSSQFGLPYLDLKAVPINIDALRMIDEKSAREANLAPFDIVGKKASIGVRFPEDKAATEIIKELENKGYSLDLFLVSEESLKKVWTRYSDLSKTTSTKGGMVNISDEDVTGLLGKIQTIKDIQGFTKRVIEEKNNKNRISNILTVILAGAISTKSSDVHIEPQEENVQVRYRLDGVLTDVVSFDHKTYKLLLSRIKLVSGMLLNVEGKAQDGRFSIRSGENDIEIRSSALPGNYSDSVVLRVLNPDAISVELEELGIHPRLLEILLHEIKKPNGMLLTTGPTGSGKTTTLYAFLKKIHSPGIKIITVENPIEYHLKGIVQTQTDEKKGYTFASGLRSILRQDPDVILIGEVRDPETAEIAVDAALTGHFVLSTLHTNNAAGAYPRLIDLGINSKVLTSAINFIIAQRLLRKICPHCKKEKKLDGHEKEIIDRIAESIRDKTYLEGLQREVIWESEGCDQCNFTGYKGRIGIYEGIRTDKKIEEAVQKNPSERDIVEASLDQNLLNMKQDGVIKILQGVTTLSELQRIIDVEEEE